MTGKHGTRDTRALTQDSKLIDAKNTIAYLSIDIQGTERVDFKNLSLALPMNRNRYSLKTRGDCVVMGW